MTKDSNNNNNNFEKDTWDLLKRESKKVSYLDNPNLQRLIREKGLVRPDLTKLNFTLHFLRSILVNSVDIKSYDGKLQNWTGLQNLAFFKELKLLIKEALRQRQSKSKKLIKAFLDLPAILHMKISSLEHTAITLLNDEIVDLNKKYSEVVSNKEREFQKDFTQLFEKVESRTKEILQFPDQLKEEAIRIINDIKNNFETIRFLSGCILGLFDIAYGNVNRNLEFYYQSGKSPHQLYYPKKASNPNNSKDWRISSYLQRTLLRSKFRSIQRLYEYWILKEFKDIRVYKAHKEIEIFQDELEKGKYKISLKYSVKKYTLEQLRTIYNTTGLFLQNIKLLIARSYFPNQYIFAEYVFKSL